MNETQEDYLKTIYLISKKRRGGWVSNIEIAHRLDINPSSVSNMLYKLKDLDLINWKPRKSIRLTPKGRKIAEKLVSSYNVIKEFFLNVLEMDNKNNTIDEICCKIEHHIDEDVSDALKRINIEYAQM